MDFYSEFIGRFNSLLPELVNDILKNTKQNSNVYFESFFEEYLYEEGAELPSLTSGLVIYLSKDDFENKKVFKKIITYRYGTGGLYGYRSVYRCGLLHRFNKFVFNEFKEYFSALSRNELHILRELKSDPPLSYVRAHSRFLGINFVLVPLNLEQEERLCRDFSNRDAGDL